MPFTQRELIVETVNKLFIYTDNQEWDALKNEVFTETLHFDMTSLGGEINPQKAAAEICSDWQAGFAEMDAVNHLAGNYLVTLNDAEARVFAYATATHYKIAATRGQTREFVGTYELGLTKTENGWRINRFKYTLKYTTGNMSLD
jgi:hypothetical protein